MSWILEIAALSLSLILNPLRASALAGPVPPELLTTPFSNDLSKCADAVRDGITTASQRQHWGPFDFQCVEGTVYRIRVPLNSKIVRQWPTFVAENSNLFGIDPATLGPIERKGKIATIHQTFQGAEIIPPYSGPPSYRAEGKELIIATNFIRTKGWSFGAAISSTTARNIVERQYWVGQTARVKDMHLEILIAPGCRSCNFKLPSPVWIITPTAGGGDCAMNAVTGEVCADCSPNAVGGCGG